MSKRVDSMKFVPLVAIVAIAFLPDLASAADFVPCSGTECSACHFATMANTIVKWLIGVLMVVFAVIATSAGFGLVTSGGNPEAKSAAKQKMVNAVVGLVIVLAGWLLVDTIIRGLLEGGNGTITYSATKILPWYTIECGTQTQTLPPSIDSTAAVTGTYGFQAFSYDEAKACKQGYSGSYSTLPLCESAVLAIKSANTKFYISKMCDDSVITVSFPSWSSAPLCAVSADATADGVFSYQPGIAAQVGHMSPALSSMLSCMSKIVPGSVGVISSISDSLIVSGVKTWAQCRLSPQQCAHAPTSYHYGHSGICGDKSYAVDFGDEGNASVLCKAANSCGTVKNCSVHNGNHVHLEIPCS